RDSCLLPQPTDRVLVGLHLSGDGAVGLRPVGTLQDQLALLLGGEVEVPAVDVGADDIRGWVLHPEIPIALYGARFHPGLDTSLVPVSTIEDLALEEDDWMA